MAKYKVGDKVRVRNDLVIDETYYMENRRIDDMFVADMEKCKGKIVTIESVSSKYSIEECGYSWTDEMFEPFEPVFKIGDKVKLRDDLEVGNVYGGFTFFSGMTKHKGEILRIKSFLDSSSIKLNASNYSFSPEMLELVETTTTKTTKTSEREESTMETTFRIKNVTTINNKVVIVEFDNGDTQKAVCMPGDTYDFEKGIEVCVMKHLLGKSAYYKALKDADKQIIDLIKAADKAKSDAEIQKRKEEKEVKRKKARAERKRAERIAEMKEAYLSALKEYNGNNGNIDFDADENKDSQNKTFEELLALASSENK